MLQVGLGRGVSESSEINRPRLPPRMPEVGPRD